MRTNDQRARVAGSIDLDALRLHAVTSPRAELNPPWANSSRRSPGIRGGAETACYGRGIRVPIVESCIKLSIIAWKPFCDEISIKQSQNP